MKISIIPAAPGTHAVLRSKKTTPTTATFDYEVPVIAWEIFTDQDADDFDDTMVTPIGVDGKIRGALRIIHGGQ